MVSWRTALLLGLAALTMPLWSAPWWAAAVAGFVVLAAAGVDFLLAAPLRGVTLARSGDSTIRLGQSATVRLRVRNGGPRTLRADVRDAWVPSAGAVTQPGRVTVRTA
ncbi:hypothetical protein [Asanoa sp. NPDC050611]|uniref:hypothetical protein n=1 Tax=Asanoa sp. NPDC050611 TaxID=3157098 RepID=UPI0033C3D316